MAWGNGIRRKITFLEDVELTIFSQHREGATYGIKEDDPGKTGWVSRQDGKEKKLAGIDGKNLKVGDGIFIEIPGGGRYGD